jgi:hypothetical protein
MKSDKHDQYQLKSISKLQKGNDFTELHILPMLQKKPDTLKKLPLILSTSQGSAEILTSRKITLRKI